MQKFLIRVFTFLFLLSAVCDADGQVSLELIQQSDQSGNLSYRVQRGIRGAGFLRSVALVSPAGTRLEGFFDGAPSVSTFEEVVGGLFGVWTLEDSLVPGSLEIHEFEISPFDLSGVFSEPAMVVTPSDGDTLGTSVFFDWEYETGETNSRSLRTRGFNGADQDSTFGIGSNVTIDFEFDPGVTSATGTLSAGSFELLNELVSPVTTDVENPGRTFDASFSFANLTTPIEVTVTSIPEPATSTLMALCGLAALGLRRRTAG